MPSRLSLSPLPAGLARRLSLTAALLVTWGSAFGEMYRWVDAEGVTVYSQSPPPSGDATKIRPDPAPKPEAGNHAAQERRQQLESDFDQREETARLQQEAAKKAEEQAGRQANCEIARRNLETIETLGARRLTTPDGEARFLSDDERVPYIAEARKQIEENCTAP